MKPLSATLAAVAFASLGVAGVASSAPETPAIPQDSFGEEAQLLKLDDVWVDAERTFAKIDVDDDGVIGVDEYAAQAVVYARLARFNGLVVIDGREAVHIPLPSEAGGPLTVSERAAIGAVARRDFYRIAGPSGALTSDDWVALRLERFGAADRNEDGRLRGRELGAFASAVAEYSTAAG
jgi:hypothetical protein